MLGLILLNLFSFIGFNSSYSWYIKIWAMCMGVVFSLFQIWTPIFEFYLLSKWISLDSLSFVLVSLCFWITSLMFLASQMVVKISISNYFSFSVIVLFLNLTLILAFSVSDMILFYFMFEASLLPTLVLILGWGYQPERLQAGMYMMLYTITASLPLILFIIWFSGSVMSSKIFFISNLAITSQALGFIWAEMFLMVIMFAAFFVKLPMYGVHLWLPKAHVEAPVSGSMVLAAVLLKLGGYGMIRMLQFCNMKNFYFSILVICCALCGGVISSIICFRQTDLKSFIAYSSIGHMSLLVVGIMSFSSWGLAAAALVMVAHGFSSSGLFAMANVIYEGSHTRSLFLVKGMMSIWPTFSLCWFLLCSLNMACPPTINLLGEISVFPAGMYMSYFFLLPLGVMSFLATLYSMYLFLSTEHGNSSKFLNSFHQISGVQCSLALLHWFPANFFVLKSELIMLWM